MMGLVIDQTDFEHTCSKSIYYHLTVANNSLKVLHRGNGS